MASEALLQQRLQRQAQREASGYKPQEYVPPDTDPRILGVRITPDDENKSFGQKILQTDAFLAYSTLTGVAKIGGAALSLPLTPFSEKARENVAETGKMMWTGLKQTAKDVAGVTGVLGSEAQKESLDYYKAHPLMAVLDVWGVVSLGTGTLLKSSLTATARSSMSATVKAAAKFGIKEATVREAFEVARFIASPARVLGKTKISTPFERAFYTAVKTGAVDDVGAAIASRLIKLGVNPEQAAQLGKVAASDVAGSIVRQGTKLKTLNAITHPVGVAGRQVAAGIKKVTGAVLGKADESAVTSLFGGGIVDTNKKTALGMERWLEAVASERGWDNTFDNRMRILQEIKGKQEFVNLSPEDFFSHFDNYVKADESVARFRQMTNNPGFVPVKAVAKETAEAMAETLADNYDDLAVGAMSAAKVGVENVVDRAFSAISEFMNENFGRDWRNYKVALRRAFGEQGNKEALMTAVKELSEMKPHLTEQGWSEGAQALINEMKATGYQIGHAPSGKKVSLAADVLKGMEGKVSKITEDTLTSDRTFMGKVLDSWGLSVKGVVEGTAQFMYRQSWVQHALKDLKETFGNAVKIARPVTGEKGLRKIKIPIERLFQWLDDHKQDFNDQRKAGTGVLPQFRIRTVFDITEVDLTTMGFDEAVAKQIVSISKKSMRELPASVTGIADKLVNELRGADGVFRGFGEFYDKWLLKTPTYMRYQSSLSVMFQLQQFIETRIMSAMLTKNASALPGAEILAGFGLRMIPKKVGRILGRTKAYLQKITAEPSLNELAIVRDELITDVQKVIDDTFSVSEFQSVTRGLEKTARRVTKTGAEVFGQAQRDSLWMRVFGGFHLNTGTKIAKAIAEKFGMTLEDAVARNADGAFLHPRLVREMQDTVRSVLTYQHGFQTSPLAKTMNIVWFPFRFQVKTVQLTSKWLSELSPVSRAVVVNNWVNFANWAGTDDGIEWRKTHQNLLYSILAYTTAWEQMGDSLDAVSRGQLLGGNTGMIGGIPFGFMYNLASELALIPEDPEQFDPATGKNFQFKQVPKELLSYGSFVKGLEELTFMMLPGMPLYTVTGGTIKGASYRHWWKNLIEQVAGWGMAKVEGVDPKFGQRLLKREFMRVRPGESRW